MKIAVLGAGVVGVATAWYLAQDGYEVVVIEREDGPARGTSFANAGGICPGFAGPWAAPGMPVKLAKWLFAKDAAVRLKPTLDPAQWRWIARFLVNCTPERFAHNKARMQRIAHYAKACLTELRRETNIGFDHAAAGVLQIFQTEEEFAGGRRAARVLDDFGVPHRQLDRGGVLAAEPALRDAAAPITGGLHLTDDETGDCHAFTEGLATLLEGRGVTFLYGCTITGLATERGRVTAVATDRGEVAADACVVALGVAAPALLRPLGIDLPIYPVKGYSLTVPLPPANAAPRACVMDEHSKIMLTPMGARLRVAGMAEIGGYDRTPVGRGVATIRSAARALFPAGGYDAAEVWAGLRPMTPDGPPYLGATPVEGLYLNVGQGSNGWTQAAGCGKILADLIAGRPPAIDLAGFGMNGRG